MHYSRYPIIIIYVHAKYIFTTTRIAMIEICSVKYIGRVLQLYYCINSYFLFISLLLLFYFILKNLRPFFLALIDLKA